MELRDANGTDGFRPIYAVRCLYRNVGFWGTAHVG